MNNNGEYERVNESLRNCYWPGLSFVQALVSYGHDLLKDFRDVMFPWSTVFISTIINTRWRMTVMTWCHWITNMSCHWHRSVHHSSDEDDIIIIITGTVFDCLLLSKMLSALVVIVTPCECNHRIELLWFTMIIVNDSIVNIRFEWRLIDTLMFLDTFDGKQNTWERRQERAAVETERERIHEQLDGLKFELSVE